jgi:hypothetical protein
LELKFELDTRLNVSCVIAVACAYSLAIATISIALNSIPVAFKTTIVLLAILLALFGLKDAITLFNIHSITY